MRIPKVHFIRSGGHRNNPWRVTFFPAPLFRRRTRHFGRKIDADLFAAEMGRDAKADPGFQVSKEERDCLEMFRRQAANAGLSMDEALAKLTDMCASLLGEQIPLAQLMTDFLAAKRKSGRRPKTLLHYKRVLSIFAKGRENRHIRDFRPIDALEWFESRYSNPNSQRSALTPILSMFRWAAGGRRKWVSSEWLNRISQHP